MKNITGILLLTFLSVSVIVEGKMSAYFSHCTFNQPQGKPYIETYLTVNGPSVNFIANTNGKFQSTIEVQWVLKQEDKIVYFDKYNLLSPELESNSNQPDFMDQQRLPAGNGNYTVELTITDKNAADSKFSTAQPVSINYPVDKVSISDIELLQSFDKTVKEGKMNKNGYELIPYLSDFFPETIGQIRFYAEIYNTKAMLGDDFFLARYAIVNDNNKQVLSDLVSAKKMKSGDVNVLMGELPLDQVTSGNYTLNIEVRNKANEMMAHKSVFFQRSFRPLVTDAEPGQDFSVFDINNTFVSMITNKDSLKDYIASLYPISGNMDRQIANNQIQIANIKSMQQYFYYFWIRQDRMNPEKKWLEYKDEVAKVNAAYASRGRKGYDTERGRVYLQYGPPNTIETSEYNNDTYPYEIWHYYQIETQANRKFVFYTRDRSSNDYVLLHSDVTGEPSAFDWQRILQEKNRPHDEYDIEREKGISTFGNRVDSDFENPR